jgi:hypothetical protein
VRLVPDPVAQGPLLVIAAGHVRTSPDWKNRSG